MDQNIEQLLLKKAEEELRETESRKEQSLEQFRDWLKKHPYLKRTRQDDKYLILYLRTKKYTLSEVFKAYERHFLFRIKRRDWFDLTDEKTVARLRGHIECGSKYVISDLTSVEPIVYVSRLGKFDTDKFSLSDAFFTDFTLFGACAELEKAQICGFYIITDFSNVPLHVYAKLSINDVLDWTRALFSCPGRYKKSILINLPPVAMTFYNIASMILPEKLKNRLVIVKNYDELKNFMDVTKLSTDLGGLADANIYINETLKIFDDGLEFLRANNDYDIDLNQAIGKIHNDDVGSFRKLEID